MGTREVLASEVGLKELYQVDNPYKTRLQAMYDSYKSSDDYKESKLTEEDYLFASHQTRAFTYHSLNDEKAAFEGKRDLLLAAGVVILSIFCPPAGAVAGVALAAADMYSAASGKDWMTGRELDDGERLMRGAFALFDLIPGVGYLNDLAKTGKVAGLAGIKASLKTSFKEGMDQATKNIDNFKLVLKHVDDFGKRVVTKIDDFGKQLDNLVNRTVISGAEELSAVLRTADNVLSEAAQNFRLNIENLRNAFVPQFAYETVEIADDVVKNADEVSQLNRAANKLDEFVEASKRFTLNGGGDEKYRIPETLTSIDSDMLTKNFLRDNPKPKNSPNPKRWLEEINGTIELDKSKVPPVWIYTDANGNKIAYPDGFPDFENGIPPQVKNVHVLEDGFKDYYDDFSKAGDPGLGNTWHHHQDGKTLQAVDSEIHKLFTHRGGLSIKRNGGK